MTGAPMWSPGGTGLCRGMLWSSNMRRVAASRCQHRATLAPAAAGVGGKRSRENEALSLTPRWSRVFGDCSLEPPSGSLTWPWMSLGLERVGGRRGRTLSCGHAALPCGEGAVGILREARGWLSPFLVSPSVGVPFWGLPHISEPFPPPHSASCSQSHSPHQQLWGSLPPADHLSQPQEWSKPPLPSSTPKQ